MLSKEQIKTQIEKVLTRSRSERESDERTDRFIKYMMEQNITSDNQMHAALMAKNWCDNNK